MRDKITNLNAELLKRGAQMFMICTCDAEDGFMPVVVEGKAKPVVICLVCRGCEKEHYLEYGEVTSVREATE